METGSLIYCINFCMRELTSTTFNKNKNILIVKNTCKSKLKINVTYYFKD